jgi:16S rRNA processing protein RimM
MPAFRDLVLVGRVVKPQGRRGEVCVEPVSDRPDRFPTLRRAFVPAPGGGARELRVLRAWPHKGRFVLEIEGVSSIDEAEALRGVELRIAEEDLDALPEGSFYHHQLVGLRVEEESGAAIGVVEDVVETGGEARVLVVRGERGEETLIPFAAEFVRSVEPGRGRIRAARPEYAVAD